MKGPIDRIVSDDLAGVTYALGLCLNATRKIEGAKAAIQEKSVHPFGVSIESHDLSGVVDPGGVRKRRARDIDARENACFVAEKTVLVAAGVSIGSDYISGIADDGPHVR